MISKKIYIYIFFRNFLEKMCDSVPGTSLISCVFIKLSWRVIGAGRSSTKHECYFYFIHHQYILFVILDHHITLSFTKRVCCQISNCILKFKKCFSICTTMTTNSSFKFGFQSLYLKKMSYSHGIWTEKSQCGKALEKVKRVHCTHVKNALNSACLILSLYRRKIKQCII